MAFHQTGTQLAPFFNITIYVSICVPILGAKNGTCLSYSGRKLQFLAPLDIPDTPGYHLGIGCNLFKACNNEIPVANQKIL